MDKPEGFFPDRELLAYRRSLLPPTDAVRGERFLPRQPADPASEANAEQTALIASLIAI